MDDLEKDCKTIRKGFEIAAKKGLPIDVLDLNRKEIQQIPSGLCQLDLSSLKYLYLEGNVVCSLPEDFFACLASLEWLDLRNNKLCKIPNNVGEHKKLKTLLLGKNQLTFLPAEMGFLKTLTGLNLSENPLEEPPHSVVSKGVYAIKAYLLVKLGFNPEDFQFEDTELEYQSTESGDNLTGDSDEMAKEGDSIKDKKEESNEADMLSNDDHTEVDFHAADLVHPRVAMSYYGALLGDIPNSYNFKPWKTGVFFKKEYMDGKISARKLEQFDGKRS